MPWPIVVPAGSRTNTTPHVDTHPDDHNKIAQALNDLSAVENGLTRVVRWGGGSFTTHKTWDLRSGLPTFPYAGIVLCSSVCQAGYGSGTIALSFDTYSDAVNIGGGGVLIVTSVANNSIAGATWHNFVPVLIPVPVAAGGKPDFRVRVWLGSGTNYYAHGITTCTYLPGASIGASEIAPG